MEIPLSPPSLGVLHEPPSNFFYPSFLIGEPFTQEEMEEMLSAAVDPDKGIIFYKDFVSMMVVEDL